MGNLECLSEWDARYPLVRILLPIYHVIAPQKIYLGNVFYGSNVVKDDLNFCFIGRINGVQFSRALFQEQLRWKSFQLELLAITTELSKWYLHIKLIFLG